MPAAETLAAVAMAAATAKRAGISVTAVIAVGDCDPAAAALSAVYSSAPQLRRLLDDAVKVSTQWLGVSMSREMNQIADALSHPSQRESVKKGFVQGGLEVVDVDVPPELWESALEAASLPLAADDSSVDALEISGRA